MSRSVFAFLSFIVMSQAQNEKCDVFPKDPVIKMGSEIQIMLRSHQSRFCGAVPFYSPGKLIWKLNDKEIAEDSYVGNSTFPAITLRNFTHRSAVVTCHMDLDGRDVVLGGTKITALYPPVKPTNIYCITNIQLESTFTCHWDSGSDTFSGMDFNVSRTRTSLTRTEPDTDTCWSDTNYCTFKMASYLPVKIKVTAKNPVGSVDSDITEIDPFTTFKIAPPEKVAVKPLLNKLEVKWERAEDELKEEYLNCEVLQQHEDVSKSQYVLMKNKTHKADIAVERPCTDYKVSVRCAVENAYWSDWSPNVTAISSLDANAVKFHLWRKIDMPDERGNRRVQLMWKGLPSSCDVDGYKVTVMNVTDGIIDVLWFNLSDRNTSLVLDKEEHRISIAVHRNNRTFAEDSILVPTIGRDLPPVETVQAFPTNSQLYVNWTAPPKPVNRYMVAWSTSTDDIIWHESQNTSAFITGHPLRLYRITVSPLYERSPGEDTTVLSYFKEGAPGTVSSVNVRDVEDTSARVYWVPVSHGECCGFVLNYTVFWKSKSRPEKGVTVSSSVQDVFLQGLTPSTKYSVRVTASSAGGRSISSPTIFTTRRYGTKFLKMLAVFGGLGVILVLTICLCTVVLVNKYYIKVPSPQFSTLPVWSHKLFKDEIQNNICTLSAENCCDKLEVIHPYTFDSLIIELSPTSPDTPGALSNQSLWEDMNAALIAPAKASPLPPMPVGLRQTCHHSTGTPKDHNSTRPCLGSILGKMGDEQKVVPSRENQRLLEPPRSAVQAYVTMDLFDQTVNG